MGTGFCWTQQKTPSEGLGVSFAGWRYLLDFFEIYVRDLGIACFTACSTVCCS